MTKIQVNTCVRCGVVYADRVHQQEHDLMPCPLCHLAWETGKTEERLNASEDRQLVKELVEQVKDLQEQIEELAEDLE